MTDTASAVAKLVADVLTPLPDNIRSRFPALFQTLLSLDSTLEQTLGTTFPSATARRRAQPAAVADFITWESGERQLESERRAVDAFITQYAAGVKRVHNQDLRYDVYLPSCFYERLVRVGNEAWDDCALSRNLGEALTGAGHCDLSYTDTQMYFPVILGDRWALVHVSYIEDRVTLYDPAGSSDRHTEAQTALDVVRDHISAADRVHFGKNNRLSTQLMPTAAPIPPDVSALVICAALEVLPSLHFRDECCPAFDKVTEAIAADTPLYDVLCPAYAAKDDDGKLSIPQQGAQSVTVEKNERGLRRELHDRVRWTWATGVPANAEGLACLVVN